jgi:alpha-amylase
MKYFLPIVFLFSTMLACQPGTKQEADAAMKDTPNEVIYHVLVRSFYDSNGDGHGDLNGLREKLPYLRDLGVTSILLLPIQSSVYYHNYFSDDFEKIDPRYGTMDDYIALVKEVHRHGLKIYLDMEAQYVLENHLWWKEGVGNLNSPYRDFILYEDEAHEKPSSIIYSLYEFTGYDGKGSRITTVNLRSPDVLEYMKKLFHFFVDPNGDGNFEDGADGFRLDHAMDTLDNKPELAGLFQHFWKPLIDHIKGINPNVKFIAEQADWMDHGRAYYTDMGADHVFAFSIGFAIGQMNKKLIEDAIQFVHEHTPEGRQQIIFIENHDINRFASVVNNHPGYIKAGAALNLLIGHLPSIYYGQELGTPGFIVEYDATDGNHIPVREAFDWYASAEGAGMAFWYKDSGPWWDSSYVKPHDEISLEEQQADPLSVYNYYKELLRLRREHSSLAAGEYHTVTNDNEQVLSFIRQYKNDTALVIMNLSDMPQSVRFTGSDLWKDKGQLVSTTHAEATQSIESSSSLDMQPNQVCIWKL